MCTVDRIEFLHILNLKTLSIYAFYGGLYKKKINDYLDHHKSAAEYPSSYNAWLRRVSSFKKLKELVLANVHQNINVSPEKKKKHKLRKQID